ncbi:MAG: sulfate adenylyltransferase [Firmicutes bacterium]|nr:sulfate adenylyltransferase [Bacillota bacterium]
MSGPGTTGNAAWGGLAGAPQLVLSPAAEMEARLLAWGAYAPLTAFMDRAQYQAVLEWMHLPDGELFPLPVVLPIAPEQRTEVTRARWVGLAGSGGLRGWLEPTDCFRRDLEVEAQAVYGTTDPRHPGVAELLTQSPWCVAGPVTVVQPGILPYPEPADPAGVRAAIQARGWATVAAFQTRNPVHRAHEYLHKVALEVVDGLLVHPLVGPTKADDLPAPIRLEAYRIALRHYYPPERVLLAVYPAPMRYAGPREALLHALVRRNYGATHMIVGRDHAGVGGYYPAEAAAEWLAHHAAELGITPLVFDAVGYCRRCAALVSRRTCPHPAEKWETLSGTELRRRLAGGEPIPPEWMRPEVAAYLRRAVLAASPGQGG